MSSLNIIQMRTIIFIQIILMFVFSGCTKSSDDYYTVIGNDTINADTVNYNDTIIGDSTNIQSYDTSYTLGAGFRYSEYGPEYDPGNNYWDSVGGVISSKFNATPECIWIVGVIVGGGACELSFPVSGNHNLIYGSSTDANEDVFNKFDESGTRVWLQVEPGNADVNELIDIVLSKYSHHKCITGFGVDVEWLNTTNPEGRQVTDLEAKTWMSKIKSFSTKYRMFLKHWESSKMPPTFRTDVVFIDDSQEFSSLNQMVNEFKDWGNYFKPAKVGFQFGYNEDHSWWGQYSNPLKIIFQILKVYFGSILLFLMFFLRQIRKIIL